MLFSDLVGSTALSDQLDPELFYELLQTFRAQCEASVERFGGFVKHHVGDGMVAYFGYPQAHDDDGRRAVAAGLDIVRQVALLRHQGHVLQVRVSIAAGLVLLAEMEDGPTAVGDIPNIADRIKRAAQPDSVVITEQVQRLTAGFFTFEALGQQQVEGIKAPVTLFRVLGNSGARSPLEAAKGAGLSPVVGRAIDAELLHDRFALALQGRGQVVSIRGNAGVGKSRLVDVLESGSRFQPHDKIACFCLEYLRNSAFHPVIAALRAELRGLTDISAEAGRLALHTELDSVGIKDPEVQAALEDLLALRPSASGEGNAAAPLQRRRLILGALTQWVRARAVQRPLLFIIEDLQWADATTVEFVDLLRFALQDTRAMIVLTYRPDFLETADILLSPFQAQDTIELATTVAGGKTLPPEIEARIHEWTGGVALYIEEFTKGLLESGVLSDRGDRFELTAPLPRNLVPASLAGPLVARIDRLGDTRLVAQRAAVLGMEFAERTLAAMWEGEPSHVRSALDRLVNADLMLKSGNGDTALYRFRHALVRQAAYDSLALSSRQELHSIAVEVLRVRFPEMAEQRPEVLAYHATEAGLAELAVEQWRSASQTALARAANHEAIAHIDAGLSALRKIPVRAGLRDEELQFLADKGPALMAVKGFAAAEVKLTYDRIVDLNRQLGKQLQVERWGMWAYAFVAGDLVRARALAEEVFRLAAHDPDFQVPAYHAAAYTLCYVGEFEESLRLARAGIALFDPEREDRNVRRLQFSSVTALHHMAAVSLWMLGFPDQAAQETRRAVDVLEQLAPNGPARAYASSAVAWGAPLLNAQGAELARACTEAITWSESERLDLWPPLVRVFQGWAQVLLGDPQGGLSHMARSFSQYRATGGGILRTTIAVLMAEALMRTGDTAGALRAVDDALATAAITHERNFEPELHRIRGELLLAASPANAAAGEASLFSALNLARRQQAKALELRAALSLGRVFQARGDSVRARDLVGGVLAAFSEGHEMPDRVAARDFLAALSE